MLFIAVFCCTNAQENADIQEVKSKRSSLMPRTCGRRILWARYKLVCQDKRNQRKLQARVSLQTFTFKPVQNSWRKYYLVDMVSQLFSQLSWRGKVKEVSLQVATANRPEFCLYPSMGLIDRWQGQWPFQYVLLKTAVPFEVGENIKDKFYCFFIAKGCTSFSYFCFY